MITGAWRENGSDVKSGARSNQPNQQGCDEVARPARWRIFYLLSRMPNRCVAANCGNKPDLKKGIVLHAIPYRNDDNPTAKKRRRQWVKFVKQKRARWEPSATSTLCSKHFKPEDYVRRYNFLEELGTAFVPRLIRDEIGEVPVPTIHADPPPNTTKPTKEHSESSTSSRSTNMGRSRAHRKVSKSPIIVVTRFTDNLTIGIQISNSIVCCFFA